MCSVRSVIRIRAISSLPDAPPNKHNIAPVACSEKIEKFAPALSQLAPSGYCIPGRATNLDLGILTVPLMASASDSGNHRDRAPVPPGSKVARRAQLCASHWVQGSPLPPAAQAIIG